MVTRSDGRTGWAPPADAEPLDGRDREAGVCYRTGPDGLIEDVGCGWDAFADRAGSPGARSDRVTGRPLEAFIADPTTRMIYRAVGERVRATARPARFPFRCDAPDQRRVMVMEIAPLDSGGLEYRTYLQSSDLRPTAPVTGGPDDGRPMLMCGWCKRVEHGAAWVEVEEALELKRTAEAERPPLISHGMCPPCEADMEANIEAMAG